MSHFTVMVIGENPEKQLDPFWELDLEEAKLKKDYRAVSNVQIEDGKLEEAFEAWKQERREGREVDGRA